jgi:hypothetical protein
VNDQPGVRAAAKLVGGGGEGDEFHGLEAGNWKLEAGSWKLEAGNWKLEAGSWKLEAGNWSSASSF